MRGYNHVVMMGNLTRDPEIRQLPSGVTKTSLGLASSEVFKNKSGEQVEKTCFVEIETWGRQAEVCAQYLSKGAAVLVEGRLQFDRWETEDGQTRSKLRVRADRVQFIGKPHEGGGRDAQSDNTEEASEHSSPAPDVGEMPF